MDFNQTKLTKTEWQSIEKPLPEKEIQVLELIKQGMADVNTAHNHQKSLFQFLKIAYSKEMEDHLFTTYFSAIFDDLKKADRTLKVDVSSKTKIKTADKIRLEQNKTNMVKDAAYEFILLEHVCAILLGRFDKHTFEFHYYTLFQLSTNTVHQLNRHVLYLVQHTLDKYRDKVDLTRLLEQSVDIIEKNSCILKYKNITLYDHQKQIFTLSCKPGPKLILYIAPTGTGKTLSPIGLSEKHRVIFVCAARHVGLSLARSAISVQKKVAFAFGCNTMEDIRLHYYSAVDYTINKKSGGIGRVNNSNGTKVEIMICDIQSYLLSMAYMLQFNVPEEVIMYWDEPTISMDYEEHDLHTLIQRTWTHNRVPNIVLSSATLPKFHTIPSVIQDFKQKFQASVSISPEEYDDESTSPQPQPTTATVYNIVSHECAKTIPIFDNNGYIVVPHFYSSDYRQVLEVAEHCSNNLTILRYLDLGEVCSFIARVLSAEHESGLGRIGIVDISQLTMENIKKGYLDLLQNMDPELWETVHQELSASRRCYMTQPSGASSSGGQIKKYYSLGSPAEPSTSGGGGELRRLKSVQEPMISNSNILGSAIPPIPLTQAKPGTYGIYLTTSDAHTLTEGPTIFLANDVEKVAQFCLQQANIPSLVMDELMNKIERNNVLSEKIMVLEKELEDAQESVQASDERGGGGGGGGGGGSSSKHKSKSKSKSKGDRENPEAKEERGACRKIQSELDALRMQVRPVNLNEVFVPNTLLHLNKWAPSSVTSSSTTTSPSAPFTSRIEDSTIVDIMSLSEIDDSWKILLLMGIGIFTTHKNPKYLEIVKQLATEQQLYLIIASSDYIYGTNYQFCHGYLSKDLDLTQEKIIQSIGRIGRNNIQQSYSIRFRDNCFIDKLFTNQGITPEITNMNRLFTTTTDCAGMGDAEVEDEVDM
jgi:hypothetical protein